MLKKNASIFVAGSSTLIGSSLLRELCRQGFTRLLPLPGTEPDLTSPVAVEAYFAEHLPEYVYLAAGRSGGIGINQSHPADLMLDNLLVGTHVIASAHRHGVQKLLYLASSCSYPRLCPQPMTVEDLMTGPLEPTNEPYAMAKLAGLTLCKAFRQQHGVPYISAIPANPFGPGDDFDLANAHVVGALIHRMHKAKVSGSPSLEIWGTGTPRREFIFVDDLARACILAMEKYDGILPLNLGTGVDLSIRDLAFQIQSVVGYSGELLFNPDHPDGMPEKRLASEPLAALGWRPQVDFERALLLTYNAFLGTPPFDGVSR